MRLTFKLVESFQDDIILYRGESYKNFSSIRPNRNGIFFTTDKEGAKIYGDIMTYVLDGNAKIYECPSSVIFCEDNNLMDIKYNFIPQIIKENEDKTYFEVDLEDDYNHLTILPVNEIDTLNKVANIVSHNYHSKLGALTYYIFQYVVKVTLENRYDGIHYYKEDNINPDQYQIWN